MLRGGRRPGAGRKPGGVSKAREKASGDVQADLAPRVGKFLGILEELAEGVKVQKLDKKGEPVVYDQGPDRQAAEYLVNRVLGRPTEVHAMEWSEDLVDHMIVRYGEIVSEVLDDICSDTALRASIRDRIFERYDREVIQALQQQSQAR